MIVRIVQVRQCRGRKGGKLGLNPPWRREAATEGPAEIRIAGRVAPGGRFLSVSCGTPQFSLPENVGPPLQSGGGGSAPAAGADFRRSDQSAAIRSAASASADLPWLRSQLDRNRAALMARSKSRPPSPGESQPDPQSPPSPPTSGRGPVGGRSVARGVGLVLDPGPQRGPIAAGLDSEGQRAPTGGQGDLRRRGGVGEGRVSEGEVLLSKVCRATVGPASAVRLDSARVGSFVPLNCPSPAP
jgi:hypothetical protein